MRRIPEILPGARCRLLAASQLTLICIYPRASVDYPVISTSWNERRPLFVLDLPSKNSVTCQRTCPTRAKPRDYALGARRQRRRTPAAHDDNPAPRMVSHLKVTHNPDHKTIDIKLHVHFMTQSLWESSLMLACLLELSLF
jgi:hypothetical protein